MILQWPQITFAVLIVLGMGVSMARFGDKKRGYYSIADVLIAPAFIVALLYFGGFWTGGACP